MRRLRRRAAKQTPTARAPPPENRQHDEHERCSDDDPRPYRQAAPSQFDRRRNVFRFFEVGPFRQNGGDNDPVRLGAQLLRLCILGGALSEKRDRQRRNGKIADLTDFQEILLPPLANLRIQHFRLGREMVVHQEGAEAVEDLREDDVHVRRRGDRQDHPQLIGHSHAAPVGGQGDDHVALDDVLLERFFDRDAGFLCHRRRRHQSLHPA